MLNSRILLGDDYIENTVCVCDIWHGYLNETANSHVLCNGLVQRMWLDFILPNKLIKTKLKQNSVMNFL